MSRTLVKNAIIVSMDPKIGDLNGGDILIDGEKIVEVGRNISADNAAVVDGSGHIVIPGLVNAHIHTWEFAASAATGSAAAITTPTCTRAWPPATTRATSISPT